ncbi:MAG: hypothetical protein QE277_11655, partial [Flectobacillus sp.]|nr:hypothetical protein [Flectobacillus sp.]
MNNFTFIKSAYREECGNSVFRCCYHLLDNVLSTTNSMPSFAKSAKNKLFFLFLLLLGSFSGYSQNLLTNGNFETTKTTPWSCYPSFSISTYTGTYAYSGSSLVLNNNDYTSNYYVWQDAVATAGKTYTISCIASTHKPTYYASVGYEFYNSLGILLAKRTEKRVTECVYNAVKFGKYEFTGVVAPSGTAKIRFVGYCNGTALKLDNIAIQLSCNNVTSGGTIASDQTVCSGSTPAKLTSATLPTGGSGTLEYLWLSTTSLSNGTCPANVAGSTIYKAIPGATGTEYQPAALTGTTCFIRCARRNPCSDYVGESNKVKITVSGSCCSNVTNGGTIATNQSGCSPFDPTALTSTTLPTGGTGSLEYVWMKSTTASTYTAATLSQWSLVIGATAATYDPGALSTTTYYLRCSRRSGCSDYVGESNIVGITVTGACCSNVTSGGTIGADQSICSGKSPAVFTELTAASGGSGTLEYVWSQSTSLTNGVCSTDASAYTAIPGATSSTYQAPVLSQTTCYLRKSRRSSCSDYTGISNALKVTVNASCQGSDPVCISRKRSVINSSYCGASTNSYGLWFEDLVGNVSSPNQHFSVKSGEFVEYCDGKAVLTYTACVLGGGANDCITTTVNYSGRTGTPPTGSPVTNTHCTNYVPSVSDWYYYSTSTGTFSGTGIYAGLTGTYTPFMAALQVGTGANLNDIASFGASSWF